MNKYNYQCAHENKNPYIFAPSIPSLENNNWNIKVDNLIVKNLFTALVYLNNNPNIFNIYREKIFGLKILFFPDEYNNLMCDIDNFENNFNFFISTIQEKIFFNEFASGNIHPIDSVLDIAEAIREMYKRLDTFKVTFDLQIQIATSNEENDKRDKRCQQNESMSTCSNNTCEWHKYFFTRSCKYKYLNK